MSIKKPLNMQSLDKLVNTPILNSTNRSYSMPSPIIPSATPPSIPSAMSNQNVLRNAGMQMMPKESNDDSSNFLGSLIAQGIAGIGTGLMGGDSYDLQRSASMFQGMRDRQESERKAKLYTDPKSEESKKRRLVYEKALGFKIPEEYSYTDLNDPVVLQSLRNKSMESIVPKGTIATKKIPEQKPEKEMKNPNQKEINEIKIRSKNSLETLNQIEDIVSKYGTTEFTGPQGKILEQLIKSVAIDYNKIKDPNSVVRSEEAESVASSLGLGGIQGFFTSKASALDQIKAFKDKLKREKENALSIYQNPNAIDLQSNEIDFTKE